MQYKAIPILLKHAGWLSRKPKWETDPNWREDKDTVLDWYNKIGWREHDNPAKDYPEKTNSMSPEEFYSLLNRYQIDYTPAKEDIDVLRRKHIKQILALLKKKQKSGVGPEAYKYWMNREPFKALDDIDYVMDFYDPNDLNSTPSNSTPTPVIFGEDVPYKDLYKLRQRQGKEEDKALGYEPGWMDRLLGIDENE